MAKRKFDPLHPGVVLAEDLLKGLEISQYRLAACSTTKRASKLYSAECHRGDK
jgi:plasmid maintenance system antidote protein VapI